MAINKKLIHFKNKENFEREVANGNILDTSIVFIQDTKEIYTHGTIYDGSTFDPSDIETSIQEINNRFNISLEYDLVEYPDILDENNNPIFTSVEEGQTLERAINTLEINVATLAQEVLNNEEVVSEALVDTANAVGLDENFHYIQNIDANYISSATSLAEADLLLDQAIKNSDEIYFIEDFVGIYYGDGTCTQQQYDELRQAILDGKLIVDRASYSTDKSIIPLEKAFLVYQRNESLEYIELHHIYGNTMYCTKMFSDLTVTTEILYKRVIVTQTSELENNSGFITEEDLPSIEFLTDGGGTKFLANDGSYKEVSVPEVAWLNGALIMTAESSIPPSGSTAAYNIAYLFNLGKESGFDDPKLSFGCPHVYRSDIGKSYGIIKAEIINPTYNAGEDNVVITYIDDETNEYVTLSKFAAYTCTVTRTKISDSPYIWDGTTSETIFNELLECFRSGRIVIYDNWSNKDECDILIGDSDKIILVIKGNTNQRDYITDKICYITKTEVSEYRKGSDKIYNIFATDSLTLGSYNAYGAITANKTLTSDTYEDNTDYKTYLNEYQGEFSFGDTVYTVTFPDTVKWSTDSVLEYKANHTYQFKIVNNLGVMKEFANS